jgi:hypothetical protein
MAAGPGLAAAGLPFPTEKLKRLLNKVLVTSRRASAEPAANAESPEPAVPAASAASAEPPASAVPAASAAPAVEPKPELATILGDKLTEYTIKKNDIITKLKKIKSDKCISIQQLTSKTEDEINTVLQALNPNAKEMIYFFNMLFYETIIQFETDPSIDLFIDTLKVCIEEFISVYPRESQDPKCLDIIQHYIVAFILEFIESVMNIVIHKIEDPLLVSQVLESSKNNTTGIQTDLEEFIVEIISAICNLFPNSNLNILQKILIKIQGKQFVFDQSYPEFTGLFSNPLSKFQSIAGTTYMPNLKSLLEDKEYTGKCGTFTVSGNGGGKAKKRTKKQKKRKQKFKSGKKSKRRKGSRKK